jgi:FKBP-type peptidyl-prolyl cis-trans isomerase
VKVHYKGTLLDGTEFDSSYKRNQPAEFRVDQVIPGWTEAMQLMSVGSTYELYLSPELAYGDRGAPPVIEPGSMLIFEVELLGVTKADDKKKEQKEEPKEKK